MKKIFLIILFSFVAYGQTDIPVVKDSVAFVGDSISQTITLDKIMFLCELYIKTNTTANLRFDVYDQGGWYRMNLSGAVYTPTVLESIYSYVPLEPKYFYGAKRVRILIDDDPTGTIYIVYDKRKY
jgi:hypothetical protein